MRKLSVFFCAVLLVFGCVENLRAFTNLSLNPDTTASANTVYNDHFASYAIDGDYSTWWNGDWWGSADRPQWIVIDLGNEYYVNDVECYFLGHNPVLPLDEPDIMFDIYTSLDGVDWILTEQEIISKFHGIEQTSTGAAKGPGDPYYNEFVIIDESLQYIKFDVVGGWEWAHLNEIEIMGNPAPIPEPANMLLLGTGLAGFVAIRKKQRKRRQNKGDF